MQSTTEAGSAEGAGAAGGDATRAAGAGGAGAGAGSAAKASLLQKLLSQWPARALPASTPAEICIYYILAVSAGRWVDDT